MSCELVIFDCDGVLVDSEPISNRVLAADISAAGWAMTTEACIRRFKGHRLTEVQALVETSLGRALGPDWLAAHYGRVYDAFREEIRPIDGITEVLDWLDARGIPCCVASQGPVAKMEVTLGTTGLWDRFAGRVFSADAVARPKPAPDLFLYAAGKMAVAPAASIVVEDSAMGIAAAIAAGMTAIGFAPTEPDALLKAGAATVIAGMNGLAPVIEDLDARAGPKQA